MIKKEKFMKLLKKSYLFCFMILSTLCLFAGLFRPASTSTSYAVKPNYNYSKYINISSFSTLSEQNVIKKDNYNYSIISNNTVSLSPNLFQYKFDFSDTDFTNFKVSYHKPISLTPDAKGNGDFKITYGDSTTTYYYSINQGLLNIYTSYTRLNSSLKLSNISKNNQYGIMFNYNKLELTYITNITYTFKNKESALKLKVIDGSTHVFNFNFIKPITKFVNQDEPIVKFTCFGHDAGESFEGYNPTWLPSERIYNNVVIEFTKNYTENNPLFFNINLNGFTYYYKIFIKENQLYLQYTDEVLIKNESTGKTSTQVVTTDKTFSIFNNKLSDENTFAIEFNEIGRYEVEFYDLTFNENLTIEENYQNNANYYSTSFYIYDDTKTFENVYMVTESYKNGQPTGYVVSNSNQTATLNSDIRTTFKNLYFLSREDFEKINITVTKTLFTGSVTSKVTEYNYLNNEFMNNCYENNKDFYIDLSEDARYKISIYYEGISSPLFSTSYEVVKLPKTLFQVGNEGDPYYDRYVEEKPYTKTERFYQVPLSSEIKLNISYVSDDGNLTVETQENSTFNKTYINEFTIFFGISQVNIERYKKIITEGNESSEATTLDIKISAVGSANVTVSFGDKKMYYSFSEKDDKVLSFSEYGTYSIYVVDEMGTVKSASFTYEKSLNTSAILLIVLSSVIVLAIVAFILFSRAKVATR